MALIPRLDLRQVHTLVMTPQLQQAIKLLQLSTLELSEYVEHALEENPLLEREDADGGPADSEPGEERAGGTGLDDGPEPPDSLDLVGGTIMSMDSADGLDADFGNMWSSNSAAEGGEGGGAGETLYWQVSGADGDVDLDNAPSDKPSLREHLMGQVAVDLADPVDRMIAVHLVDMLDDAGYVNGDLADVAATLGCAPERVTETLGKVQKFDPPGIFARNLAECLALQLRDRDRCDPAMQRLLDHLDLLGRREFAALRKICAVSAEDLAEMVDEIKALNPKPATAFDDTVTQPVIPDVVVRRRNDGGWMVEINADNLPRVLVNNRYYTEVANQASRKEDKEYIAECYQQASWLVKALHQRAQTILRVSTEIVKHQEPFLNKGVQYLKPLVLRDIAQSVEVHESTVSRVTNNKYIATPRGVFELKYFFTFAVGDGTSGDAASAEAVRFRIKALIDQESVDDVLSDDRIVTILREKGVDIARRTVAKYRESMHIPSSVQRRREKTLQQA
jgi:RNA polymerase sigma-54 factor